MSGKQDSPPPPYGGRYGSSNKAYIVDSADQSVAIEITKVDLKKCHTADLGTEHEPSDKKKECLEDTESEDDPWKISTVYIKVVPWDELTTCGKFKRIFWDYLGKIVLLVGFLYLFICSLDFLSNAFRLMGGRAAGSIFAENELLSNPVVGLMIGVLATVLFQSSSTTTSVVVSMVASNIIPVQNAIPIVMGANIGTSVTNTIVSIGQITNKNDFRRAFAGATVHDMFNWLTVSILLPLEWLTGYLFHLTEAIVKSMSLTENKGADKEFLKKLTHPFTHLVVQIDKSVINDLAKNDGSAGNKSLLKHCCKPEEVETTWNATLNSSNMVNADECPKCGYLFEGVADTWGESTVGIVLLIIALFVLCACLVGIVKTLNSLLKGKVSIIIKKFVNADFPGKLSYFTGYLAILIGTGLTILVQSSSVFTSALTPLVGIGVVSIERMYPLTLGANIGTTTTAILAALAQDSSSIPNSLQISLCHLFFNISGILIFFPIPQMRFPIRMAKFLGNQTAKYRWFAVVYLILVFFVLPAAVFGLSVINWIVMAAVFGPVLLLIIIIATIKVLQRKAPNILPPILKNWYFLPEVLRSLKPYDRLIHKLIVFCPCCKDKKGDVEENKTKIDVIKELPSDTKL